MKGTFHSIAGRDEGSILPFAALTLSVVLGFTALAVDVSRWRERRAQLQEEVDVAALAAAKAVAAGLSSADELASMLDHQAGLTAISGATLTLDSLTTERVEVSGSAAVGGWFSGMLGRDGVTVGARAAASLGGGPAKCLMALNPSPADGRGVYLHNSGFLKTTGCGVHSNAAGAKSIEVYNGQIASDEPICHSGGVTYPSWAPTSVQGTTENCGTTTDPLASLPAPTPSGTVRANPATWGWGSNGQHTISPGIYPSGLGLASGSTYTMEPGTYFITGGDFAFTGGTVNDAAGVTIVMLSSGRMDVNNNAGLRRLSAPTTGPHAGMLFWRPAQSSCPYGMTLSGAASFAYDGVIYLPGCKLDMSNNSRLLTNSAFTMVVTDQIEVRGSARIDIHVDNPFGWGSTALGGGGAELIL